MWSPVAIAIGTCAFGAASLLFTAGHLVVFALTASSHTGMAGSWRPEKLALLATLYATTALGICGAGWRINGRTSPQRLLLEGWSPLTILLWTPVLSFLFSIYYPLPYYNHHADKLYLFLGLLLSWSLWLALFPKSLGTVVGSRVFPWVRVGLCNVLLFLVLGEVTLRVADPCWPGAGCSIRDTTHPLDWSLTDRRKGLSGALMPADSAIGIAPSREPLRRRASWRWEIRSPGEPGLPTTTPSSH
jgi:hypothetical protein